MTNPPIVAMPAAFLHELASTHSKREVLATTARWLPQILHSDRASIGLPIDDNQFEVIAIGEMSMPSGMLVPLESSLIGRVHRSLEPLMIRSLRHDDGVEAPQLLEAGVQSVLICPMVHGSVSLGTMNLSSRRVGRFNEHDVAAGLAVADLIGAFLAANDRAETEGARARTDHLTGALSRVAILELLEEQFELRSPPSLLFIDVDRFKAINDRHGHSFGDRMLRSLARRIQRVIEGVGELGRFGGDEFLVLVPNDPDGTKVQSLLPSLSAACDKPIVEAGRSVNAGVSIGMATMSPSTRSAAELLSEADEAMYQAKASGQAIVADDAVRYRARTIALIDRDLDEAFAADQLEYHYQPIFSLSTGEVMGAEALLRWNHAQIGSVPADLLVQRIERAGRVDKFTHMCLHAVAQDWARVRDTLPHFSDKAVSINLSPLQLAWGDYVDLHLDVLDTSGLDRDAIIVEVVESASIAVGHKAESNLKRLADSGIVIALDDFGKGHNSLGYFTQFPIHAIKFDRSLVRALSTDHRARAVLEGVVAACKKLDVVTLGEGVETEELAGELRMLGVTHGQGWHFGRALEMGAFVAAMQAIYPDESDPLDQVSAIRAGAWDRA